MTTDKIYVNMHTTSPGGLAALLGQIRKTMKGQGALEEQIAAVQKEILEQFNIELPDIFCNTATSDKNNDYYVRDFLSEHKIIDEPAAKIYAEYKLWCQQEKTVFFEQIASRAMFSRLIRKYLGLITKVCYDQVTGNAIRIFKEEG